MSVSQSRTPKTCRTLTTPRSPWVEMEFICSRITTHLVEERCNMGHRGSPHEDISLHNHEKHMDIGSAGPSLFGGNSAVPWCIGLYSVRSGYKVPIRILAEVTRGIRDTVVLQHDLSPSHGWTYRENHSNPGGYTASMHFGLQASLQWAARTD